MIQVLAVGRWSCRAVAVHADDRNPDISGIRAPTPVDQATSATATTRFAGGPPPSQRLRRSGSTGRLSGYTQVRLQSSVRRGLDAQPRSVIGAHGAISRGLGDALPTRAMSVLTAREAEGSPPRP
jgi:hypothetical protein